MRYKIIFTVLLFSLAGLLLPPPSFALDPVVDLTGDWSGTGQEKWYYDFSESNSSFNENIFDLVCTGDWGLKVTIKQNGNNLDIQVNGKLTKAIDHIPGFDCEEEAGEIFSESLKGTIDGSKITVFDPAHGKLLGTYTSAGIKIEGAIPDEEGYLVYKVQIKPNFTPPKIGTEEDSKDDVTPETTTDLEKCMILASEKRVIAAMSCVNRLDLPSCEKYLYIFMVQGWEISSKHCKAKLKQKGITIFTGENSEIKLDDKDTGTTIIQILKGKVRMFFQSSDKVFTIKAGVVTMGVRGTEFIVDYNSTTNTTTVLLLEGTIDATTDGETRTFSGENKFIADSSGIIQTEPFSISEWNSLSDEIEPKEIIDVQDADKARTFDDIQIIGGTNSYRTNADYKESEIVPLVFMEGGKIKFIVDSIEEVFPDSKALLSIQAGSVTFIVRGGAEFIVDYDSFSKLSTVLLLKGPIDANIVGRIHTFSDESKFIIDSSGTITTEIFSISEWNDLSAKISQTAQAQTTQPTATGTGGGCLIATATFGSELAPQVQQLRELRDNSLLQTESGTTFMNTFNDVYYAFSPIIADYERENPLFKEMVKLVITPMINSLSILNYVDMDSEESVLGYGISLILLNVGMYVGIPAVVIIGIRKKF